VSATSPCGLRWYKSGVESPVDKAFAPLIGLPSWWVRRQRRQILMEFGTPSHRIGEVQDILVDVPGLPDEAPVRYSEIEGEWRLWIEGADWELSWRGTSIARRESDIALIEKALAFHDGQALQRVTVDPSNGATRFEFDLGCVLETWPRPRPEHHEYLRDQWHLVHRPTERWISVREDGRYMDGPGNVPVEDELYRPLPEA
jgi:hypothetical protein